MLVLDYLDLWLRCSEVLTHKAESLVTWVLLTDCGREGYEGHKVGKKIYKVRNDLDISDSFSLQKSQLVELCGNFDVRVSLI